MNNETIVKKGKFQIVILPFFYKFKSSHRKCSLVFLEISKNSQENTRARVSFLIKLQETPAQVSFLIKLQAQPATLSKKSLWHRCFPVNFANFLRAPYLKNTSGRLLFTNYSSAAILFPGLIPQYRNDQNSWWSALSQDYLNLLQRPLSHMHHRMFYGSSRRISFLLCVSY